MPSWGGTGGGRGAALSRGLGACLPQPCLRPVPSSLAGNASVLVLAEISQTLACFPAATRACLELHCYSNATPESFADLAGDVFLQLQPSGDFPTGGTRQNCSMLAALLPLTLGDFPGRVLAIPAVRFPPLWGIPRFCARVALSKTHHVACPQPPVGPLPGSGRAAS